MRGDLHHLFTCERKCNSFRGNAPYTDFPDYLEVVRESCGKKETDLFEPAAGKGAVARATFYFLLRYPELRPYSDEAIATLLQWHEAEPVGEYERHRNAAIFERQGNRNPLIDHPEWAARIDFWPRQDRPDANPLHVAPRIGVDLPMRSRCGRRMPLLRRKGQPARVANEPEHARRVAGTAVSPSRRVIDVQPGTCN